MSALEPIHFGHLPVWSEGNVFLKGAESSRHDKKSLYVSAEESQGVEVRLITAEDGCHLETNLYEFLGDFTCDMIHTSTLGKAFEPEQAFENPAGTPITFDRDYHGGHRGSRVLPGPFAERKSAFRLW